ncbi:MAG: hypothetical protein GXO24_00605 [Chlorobi bacterium]|nr:hypothetical protein [Chlorobiota bacterium]
MKKVFFVFVWITVWSLQAQTIFSPGALWKYKDDGSNPGANWKESGFNDASWPSGRAQLGFGDGDETTTLQSGHITYYFRKSFQVNDPQAQPSLKIRLLRDDGAIVYINGTEVARSNMPDGLVNYTTTASSTVAGSAEDTFYEYIVSSSVLVSGSNIIAVEVHQRSANSSDVSFDLGLEFTSETPPVFRKEPYLLYTANNHEMLVIWQTLQTENCSIEWGTDTTYAAGSATVAEYGNDHQYKHTLTGLVPGNHYYYRVHAGNTTFTGDFVSGANENATSFTFYAYGDTRSQPNEHDGVAARILAELNNDPASQTFIVNSGDLVYDGDEETDWDEQFFSAQFGNIRQMMARLPYLSAVGNHEGNGVLFAKYFPYPMMANGTNYYSFDYGNAHFTVIDQYDDFSPGSTQYNWIQNDLQNTAKAWKIILMHKPAWSAGGHSNDSNTQNYLVPLFEQNNVSLVINGHNHYYARAVHNNITYITTGGGGAPLYNPDNSAPNVVATDRSYHFLKIQIQNNQTLHITAIRQNGTQIEAFDITNNNVGVDKADYYEKIRIAGLQGQIFVDNRGGARQIAVYDLTGRQILTHPLVAGPNRVHIKPGLYIVTVLLPNRNVFARKIVVK